MSADNNHTTTSDNTEEFDLNKEFFELTRILTYIWDQNEQHKRAYESYLIETNEKIAVALGIRDIPQKPVKPDNRVEAEAFVQKAFRILKNDVHHFRVF